MYFIKEDDNAWDHQIYMTTLPNELGYRKLTKPLLCGEGYIPDTFVWNGSSSGIFAWLFPRWKHPIASCRHDWRCSIARNADERRLADELFRDDVSKGGTKFEELIGYAGVRLGAYLGIGNK